MRLPWSKKAAQETASPQHEASDAERDTAIEWPNLAIEQKRLSFSGGAVTTADGVVTFSAHDLGSLRLPSGRLIGCDPLALLAPQPYNTTVGPGTFPVRIGVARFDERADERVAYACITIRDDEPVRWELALRPGEELKMLGPGEFFGYRVDAGTGSFMSSEAYEALVASLHESEEAESPLEVELQRTYRDTWGHANVRIGPGPEDPNVIAFSSGWGDGVYPTYVGYAEDASVASFVTDFAAVRW